MALYLVPNEGKVDDVVQALGPSGLSLESPLTIRELILGEGETGTLRVAAVSATHLLVLNEWADQLVLEQPTVLYGVPGLAYLNDWLSQATPFVEMEWKEFARKLQKSGTTANTPEELVSRGRSSLKTDVEESSANSSVLNEKVADEDLTTSEDV